MAREWITRDFMIMASGMTNNVDVILTADKKNFYPLTQKVGMFCALTYPELFDQSDQFVLKYHHDEVDNFINQSAKA